MRRLRRFGRYVAAVAAFSFGYIAFLYLTLPDVRPLRTRNIDTTAFMDLRIREARDEGREPKRVQQWIAYARISPHLKRAVLVAEDAGFWGHSGIDLAEIRKSLETDWETGSFMRGASTITQQLAKNLYLSPTRNPLRKLRELWIARRLEAELSKTRIFELYLNNIEWGDGIWGADAAARTYFGVSAAAVGPDQAALMAGAIVNPRVLNIAHPNARLRARQRIIRGRMGYVTPPPVIALPAPAERPTLESVLPPGEAPEEQPAFAPPESEEQQRGKPADGVPTEPAAPPDAEPGRADPETKPDAPLAPVAPVAPDAPAKPPRQAPRPEPFPGAGTKGI
jgi:monofunctional biosynthetic peptidoglycan transglycosylase